MDVVCNDKNPSGNKWHWKWLSPFYWFGEAMQAINDNTPKLRQTMSDLGIPDFSVGTSVSLAGNVNVNASYRGQQVFNSANIDRSGPSVEATYKELTQVRRDYGQAWMEASYEMRNWTSSVDWAGVTNASLNVLGGAGEMIVGGTGEYFSAGTASPVCVPLMVDGGYRTATNFSRLVGYLTLNDGFVNAMPGNIGATIGKGIDMLSGVPIDGYGYGQGFGGATNDFVSFLLTGGTAGSMSNMVSNPTLSNGIWYMSAYGGYTNSLFYDFYPFKK